MITYRIVQFRCTCKYIYFSINSRPQKCPEHGQGQKSVTFWCDICGTKHTVPPLQGLKKRCYQCYMYKQRKSANRRWQKIHNEKHDIPELTSETLFEKDDRHLDEWMDSCRKPLPVISTPILDKFLLTNSKKDVIEHVP